MRKKKLNLKEIKLLGTHLSNIYCEHYTKVPLGIQNEHTSNHANSHYLLVDKWIYTADRTKSPKT